MPFQPVRQQANESTRRRPSVSRRQQLDDKLCLSTDDKKSKRANGTVYRTYSMRLTIPGPLMRMASIMPGTKVEFETDPESRRCRVRPCEAGRWTISANDGYDKGYLRITLSDGMPTVARTEACQGLRIKAQGFEFTVPDNASFERNLRADAINQPALPNLEPA